MINEFLVWWIQSLRALIPSWLYTWGAAPHPQLLVECVGPPEATLPDIKVTLHRNGSTETARFVLDQSGMARLSAAAANRPKGSVVTLVVPAGLILERDVVLPLLAERDLDRVLTYEMDRLTPFAASDLFWGWRIARRDKAHGRLHVALHLIPRTALLPLLSTLQAAGCRPSELIAPGHRGTALRIQLENGHAPTDMARKRGVIAAWTACAVLAIAVIALPLWRQQAALNSTGRHIATLRAPVAEVEALRRRNPNGAVAADVVAAERLRLGDPLKILAAITEILPDDTFLTEVSLKQGKLDIAGRSKAAARLISALSNDATIRNPAFAAPVNKIADGSADVFSIRAEAAP